MRTLLLLVFLGGVIYFMVRRAQDYGFPWEDQVSLTSYESNKRYRAGSEQLYVHGQIQNWTRKSITAEIECKSLPEGMTLTPKSTTSIALGAEEALQFEMEIVARQNATGAECKIGTWRVGGGLEEKVVRGAQNLFNRLSHIF